MMRRGVSSRGGGGAQAERRTAPPNDKGNQIVQQFFWKAVCVIVQMRMEEDALGCLLMKDGSRRVNRWVSSMFLEGGRFGEMGWMDRLDGS